MSYTRIFKLHLFRNNPATNPPQERRSGEVIFQSLPFNMVRSDPQDDFQPIHGADHTSVYDYDAHVALYIYQHNRFSTKTITDPVITPQIPITLSAMLNVPRPSCASVDMDVCQRLQLIDKQHQTKGREVLIRIVSMLIKMARS